MAPRYCGALQIGVVDLLKDERKRIIVKYAREAHEKAEGTGYRVMIFGRLDCR